MANFISKCQIKSAIISQTTKQMYSHAQIYIVVLKNVSQSLFVCCVLQVITLILQVFYLCNESDFHRMLH